ncbi:hypothetical protein BDZ94DRAFT_1264496 [Collybia nuda]|uniref:Uncharacterized protein n=1 Tax=Collybia nuda TaxID=64659 RepID=A0A9P5Y2H5_9AGAR|nr:hypothetical protein BDZ94DRAFT_1264496 [Collybia nuda]
MLLSGILSAVHPDTWLHLSTMGVWLVFTASDVFTGIYYLGNLREIVQVLSYVLKTLRIDSK